MKRPAAPLAALPDRFHVARIRRAGRPEEQGVPGWVQRRLDRRARRRANFIRAQRLSIPEVAYLNPLFDPGPEYDTV